MIGTPRVGALKVGRPKPHYALGGRPSWLYQDAKIQVDFPNNRAFKAGVGKVLPAGLISCLRDEVGYADDNAEAWSSFGVNTLRRTNKGLRTEKQRRNDIRNNSMQGAVAGTPGTPPTNWAIAATGLTIQLVGTGTEKGVDYVDYRLSGTTGATSGTISFETSTGVDALTAQVWTESAFLSFVGGAKTNIASMFLTITEGDSGGVFVANNDGSDFIASLTSALTRFSATRTLAGGVSVAKAQPRLRMSWSAAAAIDITLRIGWPQLELGAFATSPIRTTGSAVTRGADTIRFNDVSWLTAGRGTLMLNMTGQGQESGGYNGSGFRNNASNAQLGFLFEQSSGDVYTFCRDDTPTTQTNDTIAAGRALLPNKLIFAWEDNNFRACANGGSVVTDNSGTVPLTLNEFNFSSLGAPGSNHCSIIREMVYWPTALPNAKLQSFST